MTTGFSLLWSMSFLTHDQICPTLLKIERLLTSMVMLTSPSDFRGGGLMGAGYDDGRVLTNRQCLLVQFLCQGLWDVNFQVD